MSEDDGTLPDTFHARTLPATRPASRPTTKADATERYEVGRVLGRGGMGVVRIARDARIEREVAVKLLSAGADDPATVDRFFYEARVQGALEHPAVVPVHDLGIDPDGTPYFVMKRLAGTTLREVLADEQRKPIQLLARLVDICLAIDFAHSRSIVHRDIKPANIMLGDFGETYILDWGLARVVVDTPPAPTTGEPEVHGTPGYMAPEQVRGEVVDARADVYALGLVLYEILTGAPALPRGLAGLTAALEASCHRPGAQHPDVPPELDELCARATAADPAARPTARQLADGIQTYLDGDRDIARRAELADQHAQRAQAALREAATDDARAVAMREAGRALALDPSNQLAQTVLGHLMLAAPARIPAEALAAAAAERIRTLQQVAARSSWAFVLAFVAMGACLFFPVRSVWPILVTMGIGVLGYVLLWRLSRSQVSSDTGWSYTIITVTCLLVASSGVLFGPLLVMPILITGSVTAFLVLPSTTNPWFTLAAHTVPFVVLLGLEGAGLMSSFRIEDGSLVLTPLILDLTTTTTTIVVGATLLVQFANSSFVMLGLRRAQLEAQNNLHAHRWHLEQLLPGRDDK